MCVWVCEVHSRWCEFTQNAIFISCKIQNPAINGEVKKDAQNGAENENRIKDFFLCRWCSESNLFNEDNVSHNLNWKQRDCQKYFLTLLFFFEELKLRFNLVTMEMAA